MFTSAGGQALANVQPESCYFPILFSMEISCSYEYPYRSVMRSQKLNKLRESHGQAEEVLYDLAPARRLYAKNLALRAASEEQVEGVCASMPGVLH